jgi:hypothetical protein
MESHTIQAHDYVTYLEAEEVKNTCSTSNNFTTKTSVKKFVSVFGKLCHNNNNNNYSVGFYDAYNKQRLFAP